MSVRIVLGSSSRERLKSTRLRDGALEVAAPRSVRAVDRLLIEGLPAEPTQRVLTGLSPEPLVALSARNLYPGAEVRCFHHDLFFIRRARSTLENNGERGVTLDLAADLPDGPFDLAAFGFPRDFELQLLKDVVEQAHRALKRGGILLASTDNPRDSRLCRELQRVFGGVKMIERCSRGRLYEARRRRAEEEVRDYGCTVDASFHGRDYQFRTRPGVFSHAKFDEGARALIELAEFGPADALLDLGCGYGAVGIVLASQMPEGRATMVDSNARASDLARANCQLNGVTNASVALSDTVEVPDGPGSYDCVLSNPPYFSDYRISELFVHRAFELLRAGGTLQLVTKSPVPHVNLFSKIFGGSDVKRRRGYSIVTGRKDTSPA